MKNDSTRRAPTLLLLALAAAAMPTQAAGVRACSDPGDGIAVEQLPWLPAGADQNACSQMSIFSAQQMTSASDASNKVAAFRQGRLTGLRERRGNTEAPRLFDPAAWQESADTGVPGELWWGRDARNQHVLVGQESDLRLGTGNAMGTTAQQAQLLEEVKRQIEARKNGLPPPKPVPGADLSGLFTATSLQYRQIGATRTSFDGGSGGKVGEGDIPLGAVKNASLALASAPRLGGLLSFVLTLDGADRTITIPVTHNGRKEGPSAVPPNDERHRLRAAVAPGGVRCDERPEAGQPYAPTACPFAESPRETYELYGAFFGDHAGLIAVHYRLKLDSPTRARSGFNATGIVALQRLP